MSYLIGVKAADIPADAVVMTHKEICNAYEVETECSEQVYRYEESRTVEIAGFRFTLSNDGDAVCNVSSNGTLGGTVRELLTAANIPVTCWN